MSFKCVSKLIYNGDVFNYMQRFVKTSQKGHVMIMKQMKHCINLISAYGNVSFELFYLQYQVKHGIDLQDLQECDPKCIYGCSNYRSRKENV